MWALRSRFRAAVGIGLCFVVLAGAGCRDSARDGALSGEVGRVGFLVYDAGETLGLLPAAPLLRSRGIPVQWFPLTPWAAELLRANGEEALPLPVGIQEAAHVRDRWSVAGTDHWENALAAEDGPDLVVSGMVSEAQARIARRLAHEGVPVFGFHDGFQSPAAGSVALSASPFFQEIWVPTERVRESYARLGLFARVVGQPSLEAWRRSARELDASQIRQRLGVPPAGDLVVFAGQYGPGYEEALRSFLSSMTPVLEADSSLHLIVSPHPRTDGSMEVEAIRDQGLPRARLAPEGLSTMEVAVASQAVITWTSSVGVQAAFMGRPVIYYAPPEGLELHLVEQGAAVRADSLSLGPFLMRVLREPRDPDTLRNRLEISGYVVEADSLLAETILARVRSPGEPGTDPASPGGRPE